MPQPGEGSLLPDGTPQRLGRYRLVRPISTGGMARVFEARRESLAGVAPKVAVKVILPDFAREASFRELFVNEARIGSLLHHQNLVQIQDFDCEQDRFYLVMEYVDGVTLRRAMSLSRRHGLVASLTVLGEIGRQICDGLDYAHAAVAEDGQPLRLVHRDIKPSNLMLTPQGTVKVLDFGISKALISTERKGAVRGTWGYMAPEQADGAETGPAADLFGVAAVLYELAAQEPLLPEKDPGVVRDLLTRDEAARRAARLGGPYGPLAGVLVRALQRDPSARFASASAMGRALAALVPDPVSAREQLVHYQASIVALDQGVSPPVGRHRSASTLAPPSSGTAPSVGSSGPVGSGHPIGLPVAVGDRRRPQPVGGIRLDQERPVPASRPKAGGTGWRTALGALFVAVALAIVVFTGWQVLGNAQAPTTPSPASPSSAAGADGDAHNAAGANPLAGLGDDEPVRDGANPSVSPKTSSPKTSSPKTSSPKTSSPKTSSPKAPAGERPAASTRGSRPNPAAAAASPRIGSSAGSGAAGSDGSAVTEYPRGGGAATAGAGTGRAGTGRAGTGRAGTGRAGGGTEAAADTDAAGAGTDGASAAGSGPLPQADAGTAAAGEGAAPAAPTRLAALGKGLLTISAIPRAQVIVDGRYVRYSPLFRYEVDAGSRVVTLITDDGRRTTFKADVPDGGEARRVWSFEEGGFVGQ
jgi:eukaryotic-like serine/threonine-protein kinase